MRKVFLVTGFNNWGKTHIIGNAFGKTAFRRNVLHRFPDSRCDFMVVPYSNDDLGLRGYCDQFHKRMFEINKNGHTPKYVLSAFCPTKELERRTKDGPQDKTSKDIIAELYGNDEVHMLLLVHKWCCHAELHPTDIKNAYAGLANVTVSAIASPLYASRFTEMTAAIHAQLP